MPDGRRLHVRVYGEPGDTVVVVHGGPALGSEYLARTLGPLANGRTVVLYDQRGRGLSEDEPDTRLLSLGQDASDLESLRQALGVDAWAIIGDHTGAAIVALYAARHPERVSRVIALTPLAAFGGVLNGFALTVGDTTQLKAYYAATEARTDSLDPAAFCQRFWGFSLSPMTVMDTTVRNALADVVCATPIRRQREWNTMAQRTANSLVRMDLRDTLRRVEAPLLVLQGNGHPTFTFNAKEWHYAAPNGRMLLVPGWPQFPWVTSPTETFAAIDAFLRGGWPAGAVRVTPKQDSTGTP